MATITASANHAGIARLVSPGGDVGRWFRGVVRDVETGAKRNAPVDTGQLRRAIDSSVSGAGLHQRGTVTARADYALWVHEGTAPHLIEPRDAAALRFTMGGDVVFARSVKHPGTRGNPFLRDALIAVIGGI